MARDKETVKEVPICIPSDFGVWLREKRREMRLNQQDLSRILGLSAQTINAWETGRSRTPNMTIIQMKRMLSLFKLGIHDVPNGEDSVVQVAFDVDADVSSKLP